MCIQVHVVIQNGGVGQCQQPVVVVAIPAENALVFDGTMTCRPRSQDIEILIGVEITDDGTGSNP